MSPFNSQYPLDPKDANVADSSQPATAFPMSRRACLKIGGTAFAAAISLPLHKAYAAEALCAANSAHLAAFKNAQVFEFPESNTWVIRGVTGNRIVLLRFPLNGTPCQGTISASQLSCYFEHEKWEEAKQKAQANTQYFHVHGTVDGALVRTAALFYSNSTSG